MTINNVQLAKAIGALYHLTNGGDGDWTDTDEAIQQAALSLLPKMTCGDDAAAVLLAEHTSLGMEEIADVLDIPVQRVSDALRQRDAEDAARLAAWHAEMDALYAAQEDIEW